MQSRTKPPWWAPEEREKDQCRGRMCHLPAVLAGPEAQGLATPLWSRGGHEGGDWPGRAPSLETVRCPKLITELTTLIIRERREVQIRQEHWLQEQKTQRGEPEPAGRFSFSARSPGTGMAGAGEQPRGPRLSLPPLPRGCHPRARVASPARRVQAARWQRQRAVQHRLAW